MIILIDGLMLAALVIGPWCVSLWMWCQAGPILRDRLRSHWQLSWIGDYRVSGVNDRQGRRHRRPATTRSFCLNGDQPARRRAGRVRESEPVIECPSCTSSENLSLMSESCIGLRQTATVRERTLIGWRRTTRVVPSGRSWVE